MRLERSKPYNLTRLINRQRTLSDQQKKVRGGTVLPGPGRKISMQMMMDEVIYIPQITSGDKLYHYTSAAGLLGISNGEFWVTERHFLNDFTEGQVATEAFCEILDRKMQNKEKCLDLQKLARKAVFNEQRIALSTKEKRAYYGDYIISFSLKNDSPLMWSEYSNHAGYCIQFDGTQLLDSLTTLDNSEMLHGKVIYGIEQQIECLEKTIEQTFLNNSELKNLNKWDDLDSLSDEEARKWIFYASIEVSLYNMFFKLPCFEGEHEYRIVLMIGHDGGNFKPDQLWEQHFRIKDEILIPYIKVALTSIDSIERVIIGSKNKNDLAERGVKHLFRNLKHDIIVDESIIPLRY